MNSKPAVCLLCGGQSPEHEISLLSCWSVFQVIDRSKYDVHVVGIAKDGSWKHFGDSDQFLQNRESPKTVRLGEGGKDCFLCKRQNTVRLWELNTEREFAVDVAFPVLHGENGEDGTIQGLFQMLGLPYVGCNHMSSANCMDKSVTKQLLNSNGIRTAPGMTFRNSVTEEDLAEVIRRFGLPVFVKPVSTGSSVGISKAKTPEQLAEAVYLAFEYDTKVLIEQAIVGREIECGILDDGKTIFCPPPGEVIPHDEFYSYNAKYISENGATLNVPAKLSEEEIRQVQEIAKRAFTALDCRGFARIDFFLQPDGTWVLNEINTIPGFTSISLYPRLMQNAGISYADLVEKLLQYDFSKTH